MEEVASHLFYLQEGQKYLLKTKYTSSSSNNHTEPELGVVLPDDTKMLPIKQNLFFHEPQVVHSQVKSNTTTKEVPSSSSKDEKKKNVDLHRAGKKTSNCKDLFHSTTRLEQKNKT